MSADRRHPAIVRLDEASADLLEHAGLTRDLAEAQALLTAACEKRERLEQDLVAEEHDVDRLEGVSLRRVVSAMRGSREVDLDRERAEVDTAASALARAQTECAAIEARVATVSRSLERLAGAEANYESALAGVATAAEVSRAAGIRTSGPGPTIDPVMVVRATNVLARRRERRELAEAVSAGRAARGNLAEALRVLRSAGAWSAWDTFGGGGVISSAIKHDRMDEASGVIEQARLALHRFGRELDDLGLPAIVLPTTDGLTRGVDIWFDNIFTDLTVRNRIATSTRSVEEVLGRVTELLEDLEARQRELAAGGPLD